MSSRAPLTSMSTSASGRERGPAWRRFPGWLRRLTDLGALPSDSEELRLRKSVLTLSATLMATLSFVWVGRTRRSVSGCRQRFPSPTSSRRRRASTPSRARAATACSATSQLWMSLLLPFALQWSLGGFANSSAVSLWAFTCPVGALLFVGARQAVPWFAGFVGLVAVLRPRSIRRSRRARPTSPAAWWSRSSC